MSAAGLVTAPTNLSGPEDAPGNWDATGVEIPLGLTELRITWTSSEGSPRSGEVKIHRVRGSDNGSAYDVLAAVKVTTDPTTPTSLEKHSVKLTDAGGSQNFTGYLGVGLNTSFNFGDFAVLRLRGPQGNYSLTCDPRFDQPSTTDMEAAFYFGCDPPYTYKPVGRHRTLLVGGSRLGTASPSARTAAGWLDASPPGGPNRARGLAVRPRRSPAATASASRTASRSTTGNCAEPEH